jgi:hypothetical protein
MGLGLVRKAVLCPTAPERVLEESRAGARDWTCTTPGWVSVLAGLGEGLGRTTRHPASAASS